MIIDQLVELGLKLFGLTDTMAKAKRERRDRIADYFGHLSQTLADVAQSLRPNEVPHGKCAEMQVYADQLPATIGEEVGAAKAAEYAKAAALRA